ncbi:MAG: multiple sugar transport system permease protein [Thermotogota bacterium]|nr:multiple sugar transport system permease protein [Thermotogota bacterium]MDK2865530.1 multiple sugar transport system permease protein [Thermotogota bacterium]
MHKDKGWRFVLPAVVVLAAVVMFPFLFSLYISFTESTAYNIYRGRFVFFDNYISLFRDVKFLDSMRVTALYVLFAVAIETVVGTALALLIDALPKGRKIFMVLLILPMMVAPLVYGIIFKLAYNSIYGIIPVAFRDLFGVELNILNRPFSALMAMVVVDAFQWTSFVFLIVFSALQALPREPFEAALIDGASYWKSVWYITLPLLRPVMGVVLIFRIMDSFKVFDQIFAITGGGPGTATTTMSLYTYFLMFTRYNFGRAAALTIVILIAVTLISRMVFRTVYREVSYQ